MHSQGMVHGDLKGVRLGKLHLRFLFNGIHLFRETSWLTKLAMPASQVSILRLFLARLPRTHTRGAVPPGG